MQGQNNRLQKTLTIGSKNIVDLVRSNWTKAFLLDFHFTVTTGASGSNITVTLADAITNIQLRYNGSNVPLSSSMKTLLQYYAQVYGITATNDSIATDSLSAVERHVKVYIDLSPSDNIRSNDSPFRNVAGLLPLHKFDTADFVVDISNPDSTNITALSCVLNVEQIEVKLTAEEEAEFVSNGMVITEIEERSVTPVITTNYANTIEFDAKQTVKQVYVYSSGDNFADYKVQRRRPSVIQIYDKTKSMTQEENKVFYGRSNLTGEYMIELDPVGQKGLLTGEVKGDYTLDFNSTGTTAIKILLKRFSVVNL